MKSGIKWTMLGMVAVSFLWCGLVIVGDVGICNTPYETMDESGHRMGFNDRLYPQHYRILYSNFTLKALLAPRFFYSLFLLAMHSVGSWILVRSKSDSMRGARSFLSFITVVDGR